jgi:hypothetical protein
MPWPVGAQWRHSKKAKGKKANRQAAHVANSVLERTGDEGRAVRAANAVVGRRGKRKKKRGSRRA